MIRLLLALTLPLYILDQLTKLAVLDSLSYHEQVEVIPGFFNLVRVHNTGIAFGQFNEGASSNIIFTIVAVCALILISVLWKKGHFPGALNGTAVALLISGILGNLTDRVLQGFFLPAYREESFLDRLSEGYVVDFLDFHLSGHHWPSFNVADSCICVAAALLFIAAFRTGKPGPEEERQANE